MTISNLCRDMFCAGRVPDEDLKRTMKACGGSIQTTVQQLADESLGTCVSFEESQVGGERSVERFLLFCCHFFLLYTRVRFCC